MCDLPENIPHFDIGWKILFSFFAQDDLLYLLKMNVLFKFYRRQTFFVKGICQLYLITTNFKRQSVKTFFFVKSTLKKELLQLVLQRK